MDSLLISGLSFKTRIGIHDWEQQIDQTVVLDIECPIEIDKVFDDIANTIDYATVCERLTHYIESNSFALIETLASNVCELLFKEFKLKSLKLSVSKPQAIKNAQNVCVRLERVA